MNINTQDPKERRAAISLVLNAWLDRYSAPRGMTDEAAQAEANALLSSVAGRLPGRDWREGLAKALAYHDSHARTRAWPMVRELHDAVTATEPRPLPGAMTDDSKCPDMESLRRLAGRINGEIPEGHQSPMMVSEAALYGAQAVAMERSGMVRPESLRGVRSRAFFAQKDMYGEEGARAWEAGRRRVQEDAERDGLGDPLIRAAVEGCTTSEARKRIRAEAEARGAA